MEGGSEEGVEGFKEDARANGGKRGGKGEGGGGGGKGGYEKATGRTIDVEEISENVELESRR